MADEFMADEFNPASDQQPSVDPQDLPDRQVSIRRITAESSEALNDVVAAEEPLEIRIVYGPADLRRSKSLSITMRTPGNDRELSAGFLRSENVISQYGQIQKMDFVGPKPDSGSHGNTLVVELSPEVTFSADQLQRHFYMTSSCGVCGKASIEAVMQQGFPPLPQTLSVSSELVRSLPDCLRQNQAVFESTGGLHAAGLFDHQGRLLTIREDVGRHNAVDKIAGWMLSEGATAADKTLYTTGRLTSEMVIKCALMGIPTLVSRSGFTAWGVEIAQQVGLTLIGRMRGQRFVCLAGDERLLRDVDPASVPVEERKHRRKSAEA